MSNDNFPIVVAFVVLAILGVVYIVPSIVAFRRNHPNRWIILVINLAFGGTIIGWGVALVWALQAVHRIGDQSSGGESGLNLFINDPKRVEIIPPPITSQSSLADEIQRLHDLTTKGVLTEAEFSRAKAQLTQRSQARAN